MAPKRHYRRAGELRELLIGEGVELLLESNPGDREVVTFARVLERINRGGGPPVTRGSVVGPGRPWSSQLDFQREVEIAAAARLGDIEAEVGATLAVAARVLERADLTSRAGRQRALQQLCREAGQRYFTELVGSSTWQLWVGLWGRTAAGPAKGSKPGRRPRPEGLGAALQQAQSATLEQLVSQLYGPLAEIVGYRARADYGTTDKALSHLAVAVVGLADGMAIHHRLFPDHFAPVGRRTGPGGEIEPWHPFAIALEAIVNQYVEPGPMPRRKKAGHREEPEAPAPEVAGGRSRRGPS